MKKIMVLNGPNLNMLGQREPEIYGHETLADIEQHCRDYAAQIDFSLDFRQTNNEAEAIEWMQNAGQFDGLVINAAAWTHTSLALHDALKMLDIPIIEVHISNPHNREPFRHHSYVSPLAQAVIAGCGSNGYIYALQELGKRL